MIYLLLIIIIVLMVILYRRIVHKIMIYAFWLRKSIGESLSNTGNVDPSEIQKQWNVVFGGKNPDKKTLEARVKILEELEETDEPVE